MRLVLIKKKTNATGTDFFAKLDLINILMASCTFMDSDLVHEHTNNIWYFVRWSVIHYSIAPKNTSDTPNPRTSYIP